MNVEATMEDANTTATTPWEVTGAPVGLGIASAVMDTDVKVMKVYAITCVGSHAR